METFRLGLNTDLTDFFHLDFLFFLFLTHSLLHHKPSMTYTNILDPVMTQRCRRAAASVQASCGCCECSRSDIRRVLYRDTPVPTVAIATAMGLMRLLCCCMRTSPEICLCQSKVRVDATHGLVRRQYQNNQFKIDFERPSLCFLKDRTFSKMEGVYYLEEAEISRRESSQSDNHLCCGSFSDLPSEEEHNFHQFHEATGKYNVSHQQL